MSNKLRTTPFDHLPEDFTLENLQAAGFSQQEIDALNEGDDPAFPEMLNAAEPETPAQPGHEPEPQAPAAAPQPVQIEIPDTAGAAEKLARFDAEMDEITTRYDDGEITRAEMQEQLTRIAREHAEAKAALEAAAALQKAQESQMAAQRQAIVRQWEAACETYRAQHPALFSDEHLAGFDQAVRAVTGDPGLSHLTMQQMLDRAAESYRLNYTARTGKVIGAAAPADPGKPQLRTDPREPPIQTLAGVNGETTSDLNAGLFAAIDATEDPIRREAMIAKLTPSQLEAYFS